MTAYKVGLAPFVDGSKLIGREGKPYHAHADLVAAVNVALAVERPLLLTGEAGCGKTDFAFAVEHALRAVGYCKTEGVLECHVRSDSRAQDLLYHYDAVQRFGDAHFERAEGGKVKDARDYIELLALGQALEDSGPRVVLIDEIDKASRDLPNDLLNVLDRGWFEIREIRKDAPASDSKLFRTMGRSEERLKKKGKEPRPLVVITSNTERQLPDPFLRRCVFYHLGFPDPKTLESILAERIKADAAFLQHTVAVFSELRKVALTKKPTTSELIDWGSALVDVFDARAARAAVDEMFAKIEAKQPTHTLPWATLPGLGCLVKLREDLKVLRVE